MNVYVYCVASNSVSANQEGRRPPGQRSISRVYLAPLAGNAKVQPLPLALQLKLLASQASTRFTVPAEMPTQPAAATPRSDFPEVERQLRPDRERDTWFSPMPLLHWVYLSLFGEKYEVVQEGAPSRTEPERSRIC